MGWHGVREGDRVTEVANLTGSRGGQTTKGRVGGSRGMSRTGLFSGEQVLFGHGGSRGGMDRTE
jgi:hypothetical protein